MSGGCCPRCGYDLSGLMATWHESCPLEATCAECGLDLELRFTLNPALLRENRFYESARHRRRASFVRTALLTLRPRRFWAWVRLEYPFRARRALAVAGAMTVVVVGLSALLHFAAWLPSDWQALFGPRRPGEPSVLTAWWRYHADDVVRVLDPFGQENPVTYRFDLIAGRSAAVLLACMLMPLSFAVMPDTLRHARVRRSHIYRIWIYAMPGMALVAMLAPAVESIVGWASWRAGALGIFGIGGRIWTLGSLAAMTQTRVLAPALMVLWMLLWWWRAARLYLRLPHPGAVVLVLTGMSLLAAVILLLVFAGAWFVAWM